MKYGGYELCYGSVDCGGFDVRAGDVVCVDSEVYDGDEGRGGFAGVGFVEYGVF